MKVLSNIEFFGLVFVLITIFVFDAGLHSDAFGQEYKNYDMIITSQNYNSKGFGDEIVGEILNNGTDTAKSVEISAIFYDDGGGTIGYESSGTSPSTINSGDRSTFTLEIFDPVIMSDIARYDFTIKWEGEHSSNYFARLTGGEISDNSGDNGSDDDDDDDDN